MSILTANLKHLYQRRSVWLFYLLLAFFMFFAITVLMDDNKISGLFYIFFATILLYFVGLIALMQIETLNKPFTYCLPGHRKIPRQIILITGLIACVLFSLAFILSPHFDSWQLLSVILSSFFIFITIYWIAVSLVVFFIIFQAPLLFLFYFISVFGFIVGFYKNLFDLMIRFPVIFMSIGILSSFLALRWLGDDGIARRFCGKLLPGLGRYGKNRPLQVGIVTATDKQLRTNPKVESFFLARIHKCKFFGLGRYIWGSLYIKFSTPLFHVKSMILFFSLMFIFWGYFRQPSMLFLLGSMVIYMQLPLYSSTLIAGGRRERFVSTLAIVVMTAFLNTTICTTLAACTIPLEDILPEIPLGRVTLPFRAPDLRLFFITLTMIPIVSVFNLILYRRIIYFIFSTIFVLMIFYTLFISPIKSGSPLIDPNPKTIVVLIFLSWSLFLVVLKYISERRPLVK